MSGHHLLRDVANTSCCQLTFLGTAKSSNIFWIPLENACGQACHEDAIQGVSLSGDACSKTAHEMPDVKAHMKLIPPCKHGLHPTRAMLTAAVSVHIDHPGWRLTRLPVPLHQASCHGVKCLSLTSCQNRDKDLTVLISNIGAPGSCTCSSTSEFLRDLFRKDKELKTVFIIMKCKCNI